MKRRLADCWCALWGRIDTRVYRWMQRGKPWRFRVWVWCVNLIAMITPTDY
jgi:hypothetical protein